MMLCRCVELPQVATDLPETVVDVGDNVAMTCTARGTPPPLRVYWMEHKPRGENRTETLSVSATR